MITVSCPICGKQMDFVHPKQHFRCRNGECPIVSIVFDYRHYQEQYKESIKT